MQIQNGYREEDQALAAALYWEAFGAKLGTSMAPSEKALEFFRRVMRPDHAIAAYEADGTLLGIAGFKTSEGALAGGSFADLRAVYGLFGACWRGLLLSLLERDIDNTNFLMDGIFVTEVARGRGIGQKLLDAVRQEAGRRGYSTVRLDVIDTNPRAKALYLRNGFEEGETQELGILSGLFGFKSATQMVAPALPITN